MCCEVQVFSHDHKPYGEMSEDDSSGEREDEVGVAVWGSYRTDSRE